MSIFNVTATTFDYVCDVCLKVTQAVPYGVLIQNQTPWGEIILGYVSCEEHGPTCGRPTGECGKSTGCTVHTFSFHPSLAASEETNPERSLEGREQAKNTRLLHQYLGLPVKP